MPLFFGKPQRERTEQVCAMSVPHYQSSLVPRPCYWHILAVPGQAIQTAYRQHTFVAKPFNQEIASSFYAASQTYYGVKESPLNKHGDVCPSMRTLTYSCFKQIYQLNH